MIKYALEGPNSDAGVAKSIARLARCGKHSRQATFHLWGIYASGKRILRRMRVPRNPFWQEMHERMNILFYLESDVITVKRRDAKNTKIAPLPFKLV